MGGLGGHRQQADWVGWPPRLAPVWSHFRPQSPTSPSAAPSSVPWQRARGHLPGEKCPAQHLVASLEYRHQHLCRDPGIFLFEAHNSLALSHSLSFIHSFLARRTRPPPTPQPIVILVASQPAAGAGGSLFQISLLNPWQGQSREERDSVTSFLVSWPEVVRTVQRKLPIPP